MYENLSFKDRELIEGQAVRGILKEQRNEKDIEATAIMTGVGPASKRAADWQRAVSFQLGDRYMLYPIVTFGVIGFSGLFAGIASHFIDYPMAKEMLSWVHEHMTNGMTLAVVGIFLRGGITEYGEIEKAKIVRKVGGEDAVMEATRHRLISEGSTEFPIEPKALKALQGEGYFSNVDALSIHIK